MRCATPLQWPGLCGQFRRTIHIKNFNFWISEPILFSDGVNINATIPNGTGFASAKLVLSKRPFVSQTHTLSLSLTLTQPIHRRWKWNHHQCHHITNVHHTDICFVSCASFRKWNNFQIIPNWNRTKIANELTISPGSPLFESNFQIWISCSHLLCVRLWIFDFINDFSENMCV